MDLFEQMLGKQDHHSRTHRSHHVGQYHYYRYQDNRYSSRRDRGRRDHRHQHDRDVFEHDMHPLLRQLMGNKKVIGILLLLAAILVLLVVGSLILLFPILLKMAGQVGEDGVAIVLEQIKPLVDTLKLSPAK